jgi:hypothetical protein
MHKKTGLTVLKFGKNTFLREVGACVNNGKKVLIEDV